MDLFSIIFNAVSPYLFSILKLAFALAIFTAAIKLIRSRSGGAGMVNGGGNPFTGLTTAFMGYLLGRGIPVIVGLVDRICNDILRHM